MQGVPAQKAAQLAGSVMKEAGLTPQATTKATTLAASKTALAEVKDEQQALAEAAKAATEVQPPLTQERTCAQRHPGKCVMDVQTRGIEKRVNRIVGSLHAIKCPA